MLWNDKIREEVSRQTGIPLAELKDRRSGRSTSLALLAIARCYELQGEWVAVQDHSSNGTPVLFTKIRAMVRDLGFEGFEFNALTCELRLVP